MISKNIGQTLRANVMNAEKNSYIEFIKYLEDNDFEEKALEASRKGDTSIGISSPPPSSYSPNQSYIHEEFRKEYKLTIIYKCPYEGGAPWIQINFS